MVFDAPVVIDSRAEETGRTGKWEPARFGVFLLLPHVFNTSLIQASVSWVLRPGWDQLVVLV